MSAGGQTAQGISMMMDAANKTIKAAIRHIDTGVINSGRYDTISRRYIRESIRKSTASATKK